MLPEDGLLGPKHVASILKYKCIYFNNGAGIAQSV
jgi:hypothetical protein